MKHFITFILLSCSLLLLASSCTYTKPETSQALHRKHTESKMEQKINVLTKYEPDSINTRSSDSVLRGGLMESDQLKQQKNVVALTFNDGPIAHSTETLLDLLKELNVKATFFVIGNQIEGNETSIKRMVAEGHRIGNHTFTHQDFANLSIDDMIAEFTQTEDQIADVIGIRTDMVRAPYGNLPNSAEEWLAENDYHLIGWDYDFSSEEDSLEHHGEILNSGDILLYHEEINGSLEAVQSNIERLKRKGYMFVTIPELYHIKGLQ